MKQLFAFLGLLALSALVQAQQLKASLPADRLIFDHQRELRNSPQDKPTSELRELITAEKNLNDKDPERIQMRLRDFDPDAVNPRRKEDKLGLKIEEMKLGPGSGGGGNFCLQKVAREAEILKAKMQNNPILPLPAKAASALQFILDNARLFEDKGLYRNGSKVDALILPELGSIVFDSTVCNSIHNAPSALIQAFILHQALGLLGIDDSDFLFSGTYLRTVTADSASSLYRSFDLDDGFDFRQLPVEALIQAGRNLIGVFRVSPLQFWPRPYILKNAIFKSLGPSQEFHLELFDDNGNGSTLRDRSASDVYMTSSYFQSSGSARLAEEIFTYPCLKDAKKKICADDTVTLTDGYKTQVLGFSLSPTGTHTRILVNQIRSTGRPDHIDMRDIQEIIESPLQNKLSKQIQIKPQSENVPAPETVEELFNSVDQRLALAPAHVSESKGLKTLFETAYRTSDAGNSCLLRIREHLISLGAKLQKWSLFSGHEDLAKRIVESTQTVSLFAEEHLSLEGHKMVDAINYPSAHAIHFDSHLCEQPLLAKDPLNFETFLAHEIFGLNLVDDRQYKISNSFYLEQRGQISSTNFKRYHPVLFDSEVMAKIIWKDRSVLHLYQMSPIWSVSEFLNQMNLRAFSEFRTLRIFKTFWRDNGSPYISQKSYYLSDKSESYQAEPGSIFLGQDFFSAPSDATQFIPCASATSETQMICVGDQIELKDHQQFEVMGMPLPGPLPAPVILFKKLDGKNVSTFEIRPLKDLDFKLINRKFYF